MRHKSSGFGWQCDVCFREGQSEKASERTGEKNGFYGKKHKEASRNSMSKTHTEIELAKPLEERIAIGKRMSEAAYFKFGCNPMDVDWVEEKHHESTHSPEFIVKARERQIERLKSPEYIDLLRQKSTDWWKSEKGEDAKEILRQFVTQEWNTVGGKFYEKREENLKTAILLMKQLGLFSFAKHTLNGRKVSKGEQDCAIHISQQLNCKARPFLLPQKVKSFSEIDLYFESFKTGIEYNGIYYHSEMFVENNYHLKKLELCEENDVRLVQIFSHEWEERKYQILSFLQGICGMYDFAVGARECEICEVSNEESNMFLEKYHIQGKPNSILYSLGLKRNGELLQLTSFAKHHRNNEGIVLNRMTSKKGIQVKGGFARLCRHASAYFKQDIISWVDRRWSQGNGYLRAGWVKDSILPPDYFYMKGNKVVSKQSRKKENVKTPEWMTEHEHALLENWLRVYDCGKIRFIYPYKLS